MRIIVGLIAAFAALVSVPAMAADWFLAETAHFKVYSEDSQQATEEFARDLERLDEVLRILSGIGPDDGSLPESAKVTVFRFGETADMAALVGAPGSGVGGFFIGRASGSVAFVPRRQNLRRERGLERFDDSAMALDPKATLFHEYVHYFMFQHRDAPYPLWYSEGFAELFSNVTFEADRFVIGDVPSWHSAEISSVEIDLEDTFDPPAKRDRFYIARTYGHGWLIASHLNLNPARRGQMGKYMAAIAEGKAPMEAAEVAFGDLKVLHDELETFRKGRARVLRVPYLNKTEPAVAIRKLGEDEAARMALMIQSKRGVDEDQAKKLVSEARTLVSRYPQSAAVLLAASEAELDARNWDEAEALAKRSLEVDPASIDAEIYLAQIALIRAQEHPVRLAEARGLFIKANNLANDHAFPLYGYYLTHLFDGSEPVPESAKQALEDAFRYAPFDFSVRQALVHMLLTEDRLPEAKVVGASWLLGKSGRACMLRKKVEMFEQGDKAPLLEEMRPDHPGKYLDEAARKAERDKAEAEIKEMGCET